LNGKDSVATLISLLRGDDDRWPMMLLGAGASFRSGVPTAAEAVKQIARIVYSERELGGSRPPERVKPSEWEAWLRRFTWFIPDSDRLAENFPLVVEHLLVPAEYRKKVLLELMRPVNGISSGYHVLADLVMRGLIRTMLTTNFDPCLPEALRQRQPHIRHVNEVNRGPNDFEEFDVFSRCQIVWLHGKAEQYSDKNSVGEIRSLNDGLTQRLRPLLRASPVIVIGYRGSEPSIMEGLFGQNDTGRLDFPNGVFWCVRGNEPLHPNVSALAQRLGSNFQLLYIDGFDEALEAVAKGLVGKDRYAQSSITQAASLPQAFDERVIPNASIADLDMDLALTTLRVYCEKLGRSPISRDTLPLLMKEQGLLSRDSEGNEHITNGAMLLFGREPQKFIPQAVVAVTEAGKKREVYDGNLISQHRKLLEKMESPDVNPILKLKKRRSHNDQTAYPPRVLTELLVNLLVHRDYEAQTSSTIDIQPGQSITLSNSGGLTQSMAQQCVIQEDGLIILANGATDQRNPSLCDIFFGISAMERAGTGLVDVRQLMLDSSGESAFFHGELDHTFTAVVRQPTASGGSLIIAYSDLPTGLYVLNALPFGAMPDSVSIVKLTMRLRDRPKDVRLEDCGTFVERANDDGAELWSFVPLDILLDLLAPIVDRCGSTTKRRSVVEANEDDRRVLSWLLRKHLEYHLSGFEDDGLMLEAGKRHRAYFKGVNATDRTVVWDSDVKRGNRRDVVKQRGTEPRVWFENEGFGYEIVYMGGIWCARIKPFYMFTGPDSVTPLPSYTRTAKATRRIKFDRNKNVETDLAFWSKFLGEGNETMNIGDLHVTDLLIDTKFLTVEAPDASEAR